jgi:hypothetical protein
LKWPYYESFMVDPNYISSRINYEIDPGPKSIYPGMFKGDNRTRLIVTDFTFRKVSVTIEETRLKSLAELKEVENVTE